MRCLGFLLLLAVANWNVVTLALAAEAPQSPLLSRPDGGISEDIYSELVLFTKYSSAIYQFICPRPLGNTLINSVRSCPSPPSSTDNDGKKFSNVLTHAHGLIARDEARKEIVVAFRGSYELMDVLTGMCFVHSMIRPLISISVRWKPRPVPARIARCRK